ncbi:MAG: response regulator [Gammaproteobacteria bacterium]|nr:response regulator [Gammaproteobacteria bacterium]
MQKIKVLIVDDAAFTRDIMRKGLRAEFPSFTTEEAPDGLKAQKLLEKKPFDLILCDWEMPEMNGAELLTWIRNNDPIKDTPFIMVTSRGDKEHVVKAIELKVNNYIVKPFSNDKLGKVVANVLQKTMGLSAEQLRIIGGKYQDPMTVASKGLSGAIPAAELTRENVASAPPGGGAKSAQPSEKVLMTVRFRGSQIKLLVKEISSELITGIIKNDDQIPPIMEMTVVDVSFDGITSRLNAFVYTLQARGDSNESEFVDITLKLVDQDDSDKMKHLQNFIDSIA